MEVGGLRTAGSLLCVKGMRELDTEVWQKGESLRKRKEAQASSVTVISLWIAVIFRALSLLFTLPAYLQFHSCSSVKKQQ